MIKKSRWVTEEELLKKQKEESIASGDMDLRAPFHYTYPYIYDQRYDRRPGTSSPGISMDPERNVGLSLHSVSKWLICD